MAKSEKKEPEEEILINRMFSGYDLDKMLGKEAINIFKDDNNNNYIYLLSNGVYAAEHFDTKKSVLIVREINKNCVQVLGKATDLDNILENQVKKIIKEKYNNSKNYKKYWKTGPKTKKIYKKINEELQKEQIEYIKNNNIRFNNILLNDIYPSKDSNLSNNSELIKERYSAFITFKANKYLKPKKVIFIHNDKFIFSKQDDETVYIEINRKKISSTSLVNVFPNGSLEDEENFNRLKKLLEGDYWEKENTSNNYTKQSNKNFFLQIIGKERSELVFSNLIAYYLKEDKQFYKNFMKNFLKIQEVDETSNYQIIRESEDNIDIFIRDEKNIVVIENKIDSDINGKNYDKKGKEINNQLDKYLKYVNENYGKNYNKYFFILKPAFNQLNINPDIIYDSKKDKINDPKYRIVTYNQLYDVLNQEVTLEMKTNLDKLYYEEFLKGLEYLTKPLDENNFNKMLEKLNKL